MTTERISVRQPVRGRTPLDRFKGMSVTTALEFFGADIASVTPDRSDATSEEIKQVNGNVVLPVHIRLNDATTVGGEIPARFSPGADASPLWIPQVAMALGCVGFAIAFALTRKLKG